MKNILYNIIENNVKLNFEEVNTLYPTVEKCIKKNGMLYPVKEEKNVQSIFEWYDRTTISRIKRGLESVATNITIPEKCRTIDNGAFWDNTYIEEVIIEEGVRYIGSYAFKRCTGLNNKIITLPKSLIEMGEDDVFDRDGLTVNVYYKTQWYEYSEYDWSGTFGDNVTVNIYQ